MTLIITLIRPEGVWQSADNRVTRGRQLFDDDTPKQLKILTTLAEDSPSLLLAFTGIAEMPDGTPTLSWIRETIRGEARGVNATLELLRDRLNRDVRRPRHSGEVLVLAGGVFEPASGKRFFVQIANISRRLGLLPAFELNIAEVAEPTVFAAGTGAYAISKQDWSLLTRQLVVRPASWDDHRGLLAAVNRRAAAADPKQSVSPWCVVSAMSGQKDSSGSKIFRERWEPQGIMRTPMLLCGMDFTDMMDMTLRGVDGRGQPTPEEFEQAQVNMLKARP